MKLIKYISLIIILLGGITSFAQNTAKSYTFYKNSKLDSALVYINKAIETSEKENSQTWQLRGVIYRDLEKTNSVIYRVKSLESFIEAAKVDSNEENRTKIKRYLTQVNYRYYRDAVEFLQSNQLINSEKSFISYNQNIIKLELDQKNHKTISTDFYNALAGSYIQNNLEKDDSIKVKSYSIAIGFYEKTIQIDSLNYKANYGTGLCYYNQAVDLIMGMNPFETSIDDINEIQNQSILLFKKGEPFLLKAYQINPIEIEVLEGLAGIYNSMNETEKFEYFDNLLNELNTKENKGE